MTVRRHQTTFHQTIRFFRHERPTLVPNPARAWANRWMEPQSVGKPVDKATKRLSHHKSFSVVRAPAYVEAQKGSPGRDLAFNKTSDFGRSLRRETFRTSRVPAPIISSDAAIKGQPSDSIPRFQRLVRAHHSSPKPLTRPIDAADRKPEVGSSLHRQTMTQAGGEGTAGTRKPNLRSAPDASIPQAAVLAPAVYRFGREPAYSETPRRSVLSSERTSERITVSGAIEQVKRNDARVAKPVRTFGTPVPVVTKSTATSAARSISLLSKVFETAPRPDGRNRAPQPARDFDAMPVGSTREPEISAAVEQPANVVGELWLDTLSLREWLQAYLSGEIGHALQATNRFGTFVE